MSNKFIKEEFKKRDEEENLYYEEYFACRKSWKMGTIIGLALSILGGLLISGFEFSEMFIFMGMIFAVPSIWLISTIFGLFYTEDFGCSCIPAAIFFTGSSIAGFFAGTYVLIGVAIILYIIIYGLWFLGFLLFLILFPLETLYYWIRYSFEKRSIMKDIKEEVKAQA